MLSADEVKPRPQQTHYEYLPTLKNALLSSNLELLQGLIFDFNMRLENNQTLLHFAVINKLPKVVEYLLVNKANPNMLDDKLMTPIQYALSDKEGNESIIKSLSDCPSITIIEHECFQTGDFTGPKESDSQKKNTLESSVSISSSSSRTETMENATTIKKIMKPKLSLLPFCKNRDYKSIQSLLDFPDKIDFNDEDEEGNTAIHFAIKHEELTTILNLTSYCDLSKINLRGDTPMSLALHHSNEIIRNIFENLSPSIMNTGKDRIEDNNGLRQVDTKKKKSNNKEEVLQKLGKEEEDDNKKTNLRDNGITNKLSLQPKSMSASDLPQANIFKGGNLYRYFKHIADGSVPNKSDEKTYAGILQNLGNSFSIKENGALEEKEELLDEGIIFSENPHNVKLLKAIWERDYSGLNNRELIDNSDIDAQNMYGQSPLHLAVLKRDAALLDYCFHRRANPFLLDHEGKLASDLTDKKFILTRLQNYAERYDSLTSGSDKEGSIKRSQTQDNLARILTSDGEIESPKLNLAG